ncbi:Enoyl-CoA hydratase / 3-hydroxyacyl-CoA dehydrogenase / 3-hydroxybutyryl-CoA epimerase [hydrothermal vent metagenome]|uniref:enoyl-CoA hydratase n=1 Tax=hydrothermal vent metagenome TaxID=652676 RepID=A0A3B1CCI3_9ZZZZ
MATKRKFKNWWIDTDNDDITWLWLDKEKTEVNTLCAEVLKEFDKALDDIGKESPRGLVIISGKTGGFIAGADIKEFTALKTSEEALHVIKRGQSVFDKLEALPFTTVAAIDGFCLGGGMELALACNYRVATYDPGTKLGLPEVNLGIHPGFGGTMRLTRLIGGVAGLEMILSGRPVNAKKAKKLGIISMAVPLRGLKNAARLMIMKPQSRKSGIDIKRLADMSLVRPFVAKMMRKKVAARALKAHYPAPYAVIDLWEKYFGSDVKMLDEELKSISNLIAGETAQNLVRVFFLQEKLKAIGKKSKMKFSHIHVVGAGIMGGDIAAWAALKGFTVTLQDREPKFIAPAIKRAHKLFKKRLKEERLIQAAMDRLIPDVKGNGAVRADCVIEAVFEDVEIKKSVFKEIEPKLKRGSFIATNTSSIPIEELTDGLKDPRRLVGVHFFNPVAKMALVEVVKGRHTSKTVFDKAVASVHQIGKLPLPVTSKPGFLVNRVLIPYLMEGILMLEENIPAKAIDKAATGFGMPMGPVILADTVGLDICLHVGNIFAERMGMKVPEKLKTTVEAGHVGIKSGRGFYEYKNGKPVTPKDGGDGAGYKDLEERLMLRFLNECVACLREGIVADGDLVDAGMIFGSGFAPFTGGPVKYIMDKSPERLVARLGALEKKYGPRFCADDGWGASQLTGKD